MIIKHIYTTNLVEHTNPVLVECKFVQVARKFQDVNNGVKVSVTIKFMSAASSVGQLENVGIAEIMVILGV